MHVLQILIVAIGVVFVALIEVLDWTARLEMIKERWPGVWKAMNNRPARLVLLIIAITFLARDFRDVTAVAPAPIVRFGVPPAPSIVSEGHIEATAVKSATLGSRHPEGSKNQKLKSHIPIMAAEK